MRLHPSTAFQTLVDYDGYSISSKEFLPTIEDIMVIELNSHITVHFAETNTSAYILMLYVLILICLMFMFQLFSRVYLQLMIVFLFNT